MAKINLTALKVLPSFLYLKALPGDNVYVPGGVALNISGSGILDPKALGISGPTQVPAVTPGVFSENMGGYYANVVPTTGGLGGYKLQYFAPGGAEIGAGAYNAAITGGNLVLSVPYES